jgi:serine/threonine protein kinase/tetratricopeptide (TPR) repeat protein
LRRQREWDTAESVGTSNVSRSPRPGSSLGPYLLLEPLGQGGVALVFKARDERSGEIVAVKSVRLPREGMLASLRREINVLEGLRHPGVIRIRDSGVSRGVPWYAMDLLEGQTLRALLHGNYTSEIRPTSIFSGQPDRRATMETLLNTDARWQSSVPSRTNEDAPPPSSGPSSRGNRDWFLGVIRRLCEPLAYVHGEGIVHRDLSPGNVFVLLDGTPILMDFGLVWRLENEGGRGVLSVEAAQAGTLAYIAPEQARGDAVDARSDHFSLGCMMYEALTGRVPFPARTLPELIARHRAGPPARPERQTTPPVPTLLSELVMGLLELDPRDRIGHASNVAAILADIGAPSGPRAASAQTKSRAYLYRPSFVGRHGPLDSLLEAIGRLKDRQGGCLLVGGESGIGKTTLAFEAARRATLDGVRVVVCQCATLGLVRGLPVRRGGPLYPFASLLQVVADRCVAGGPSETARLLGERARVLAVAEGSLESLPGVHTLPAPTEVPSDAARRRLIDALAETLGAFAAHGALLIVLEDLQWADDTTLAFLSSLSESYYARHPVLLLGTYRLEEADSELHRLSSSSTTKHLRLERIDADAIVAMASEMLAQKELPERLGRFLTKESSGNPFFVAEYLRAAVEAGLLFRDGRGRWRETEGSSTIEGLGLPKTLQELVSRRLQGLPAEARGLAEAASVLGRDLDIERLCELALTTETVADGAAFEDALRILTARHVLEQHSPGAVRFSHDRLREAAYQELSPERLPVLHRASANLLERYHRQTGTLERSYATLAHHFDRAGEHARALFYFDRAGDAAHAMHANREALQLLRRAETLDERLGRRSSRVAHARRLRLLGLNALALGDLDGAFKSLTRAASAAGRPWPASRPQLLWHCGAALGREIGRRLLPALRARRSPTEPERELLIEAARAYERLVVVNFYHSDLAGGVLAGLTNLALAETGGGTTGELALGYATFGAMCSLSMLDGPAQWYCRRASRVAHASKDELAETWVLMNVAIVHLNAARWLATEQCMERVRAMSRRLGFSRRWEEATSLFSTARLIAGRFEEADTLNQELLATVDRADPQSRCWAVVRLAELALLRGDPSAAVMAARQGEGHCQEGLQRDEWVFTLGALALGLLRTGQLEAARDVADRCAGWIDKGSTPVFYNVFAYAAVAEVYFSLWQAAPIAKQPSLLAAFRRSVGRLRSIGRAIPIAAPRAAFWSGVLALHAETGQRSGAHARRAERQLRSCIVRARRLQMPYDEALGLAALGEYGLAGPVQSSHALETAFRMFERAGASHDLARVQRLLTRSPPRA